MASKAGWQTTENNERTDRLSEDVTAAPGGDSQADAALSAQGDAQSGQPLDQAAVENLLRGLVARVEESERRYGQALDQLHARLDALSQTTDAARSASPPEDAERLERLHAQVSNLARRLENEPRTDHRPYPATEPKLGGETDPTTDLDEFERLGRALTGGMRGDLGGGLADGLGRERIDALRAAPEPSPFARSISTSRPRNHLTPEPTWAEDPLFESPLVREPAAGLGPAYFNNQLIEMANRLEQSIGAAMPSSTIDALNARLEEVGNKIAQSLEATPTKSSIEHVEEQIADMGKQLNRAEEQLGRLGGVEERLLGLLSRLEEKDTAPHPLEIDAAQLQEIAAKAAVEAARLVADGSQKTTDRLEAMQRELNAVGNTSRQADDRLSSSLESVHASLKQLVQQVEAPAQRAPQTNPFIAQAERKRPKQARPRASQPAPQPQATPSATAPAAGAPASAPEQASPQPQAPQAGTMAASSQAAAPRKAAPQAAPMRQGPDGRRPDSAERDRQETPRKQPDRDASKAKPRNLLAAFERARGSRGDQPAQIETAGQDRPHDARPERDSTASDDMVAAARRAAQAAAAQAA
ncbi:MAG: hypothetical protein AAF405_01390, partial [Pseudomonadota bacterium]